MVLIFLAFITGLHYGSKVKNSEVIDIPNPVKKIKENSGVHCCGLWVMESWVHSRNGSGGTSLVVQWPLPHSQCRGSEFDPWSGN